MLSNRTRRLHAVTITTALVATAAHADGPPKADPDDITVTACLAAVQNETSNSELTVLGKDYSEANSAVMIGVGPDRAPWRCLVSNDGVVAEVTFTGDDGAP